MRFSALLALSIAGSACHAEVAPRIGDEPTLAVVSGDSIACGAVAVAPRLAVTANHCARTDLVEYLAPATRAGEPRHALGLVVWRDAASDLAAFAAEGLVPAELAEGQLDPEHVTTVVTHVPKPWSVVTVRLSEVEHGFLRTGRLRTGMSGSGLWDRSGRLVGVAVGNDARRGYFAGTERIAALLRGAPEGANLRAKAVELRDPSLWESESLTLEEMLAAARRRHERIGTELDRLPPVPAGSAP